MAEERIEIKYNKEDCPCIKCESVMFCEERICEKFTEWEYQEKDIVYNRQEAIEKISERLEQFTEIPHVLADIALNALLDKPTIEERVEEITKNNPGIPDYDKFYKALKEGK